jgi:transketolase
MDFESIFGGLGYEYCELDGHSLTDLQNLHPWILERQAPRVCCLKTIKGKGVSFMENVLKWHHSIPDETMFKQAMEELK